MNYAKILPLAAIAALNINNVYAQEDINNDFYIPAEYEFLSETALGYSRTDFKHGKSLEDFKLSEEITLGLINESAVSVKIANRFNSKYVTNQDYNNDYNLDYEIGIKKNLRSQGGTVTQFGASYYTFDPESWYGKDNHNVYEKYGNKRWQKYLNTSAKIGFELENGLMPYATFDVKARLDSADRDLYYKLFAGVHKLEYNYSFDTGLRYEFESSDENDEAWFVQLESDYFINDTTTIGGYGEYQFAGSHAPEIDYGYTAGVRFKILF